MVVMKPNSFIGRSQKFGWMFPFWDILGVQSTIIGVLHYDFVKFEGPMSHQFGDMAGSIKVLNFSLKGGLGFQSKSPPEPVEIC